MTLLERLNQAEAAMKASQDTPHEFLDSGADERLRLYAEYQAAALAYITEPSPSPIPMPDTQIDPTPAPSRLTGVVSAWDRSKGRGCIQCDGQIVSFWRGGLTQAYTPGVGDRVTFRMSVNAGYGEVSECAVGVTCLDLPEVVKTNAQVKARQEAQKREDLIKSLAARREARQKAREGLHE